MRRVRTLAILLCLSLLAPSALALAGLPCAMQASAAARADDGGDAGRDHAEPGPCHGKAAAKTMPAPAAPATGDDEGCPGCGTACMQAPLLPALARELAAIATPLLRLQMTAVPVPVERPLPPLRPPIRLPG